LVDWLELAVGDEAYDAFISYATADWRHAADIDSVLRTRGLTPFFDRRNLLPGLPWVPGLEKALNASKAAIILIGPRGLGNIQHYERDLAVYRQSRDPSFLIVPVILPEARIDRPFNFLQILTWIDFSHVSKVPDAPAEIERLVAAVHGGRISPADAVREAICPYRGLDAFREEDSVFFFGRGAADDPVSPIGQLVRKVREHRFVMVVGRSGTGKSSLVYAGLLPALRRTRDIFWNVLTLRPGGEPLEALAIAFNPPADGEGSAEYAAKIGREAEQLRAGDPELLSRMIRRELERSEGKPDRLLLYIDQWEELYAQAPSPSVEKDRAAHHTGDVNRFINLLLNASQSAPVSVVATVRADFYDPLIGHDKIRALLPTQQVLLGSMSRADLESTIVEPAKLVGLTFDPPQLVSRILDEAGEDEGMLPLLQYALKETWAAREGSVMTGDSYTRSGGVREAIRLTAERTFDELSPGDQDAARKLFLRLVTPGEGQEDTRARADMPLDPVQRRIVEQFAGPRTRLLVTGSDRAARPTVEVAHEALIRTWPRLRQWVDANREKLRARAAIVQAKADWEQNSRREDLLLRDFQLERARVLAADPGDTTLDDIKEFIAESESADARRRAEQEAQRQAAQAANAMAAASHRVAQRTLAWLVAITVLALLAVVSGIYAFHQTSLAEIKTREAEANFREGQNTESRLRAEQAKQAGADAVTAALAALEGLPDLTSADAAQRTRPLVNEAWAALYGARLNQHERAILHTGSVISAMFAPDGDRILTASTDGTARLWDRDGKVFTTLTGHTGRILTAVFAPRGGRILTAATDNTARLWDHDGKPLAILHGHTGPVVSAVFAHDGGRILTASEDRTARLWDSDGKPLATLTGHADPVTVALFALDGGRILTISVDRRQDSPSVDQSRDSPRTTARLWDSNGQLLATLQGLTGAAISAAFSPDGDRILIVSADGAARLWDRDGKPLDLRGLTGPVTSAAFSPDAGRILTTVAATAWLRDRDGNTLAILEGHTSSVTSAAFASDGGRILTASADGTARLWDRDGKPLAILTGNRLAVFAPDGGRILTASAETARLWDLDGKLLATLAGHTARVTGAVFAPDGGQILTTSDDETARLWDRDSKLTASLVGHSGMLTYATFAPDGSHILTVSADNTARLWDRNGKPLANLAGSTLAVFAPDDGRILTASAETAWLWDGDGNPLATLAGHTGTITGAVFASGSSGILTASTDKTARLWDRDGKLLARFAGHPGAVTAVAFAPDGGRILTATTDGTARLWDRHGKTLTLLSGHTGLVLSAVFAPDGSRILTASSDKTARLWDRDGKMLAVLEGHTAPVTGAVFAPDGAAILTASEDSTARLWDRDGKPLATLQGHTGPVTSAVFAPERGRLLTASTDRTARLWDSDAKPFATLAGHTDWVLSAVFAPDGRRILTASADKTAQLWEAFPETQGLIDRVKADVPRCLTPEQRQRLFLAPTPPRWCVAMHKWPYDDARPARP
jgi:WD40 repeat protein